MVDIKFLKWEVVLKIPIQRVEGAKETYIGLIDIKKREQKYSIGKLIHSLEPIKKGDRLKWVSERDFRKLKKKYKIK